MSINSPNISNFLDIDLSSYLNTNTNTNINQSNFNSNPVLNESAHTSQEYSSYSLNNLNHNLNLNFDLEPEPVQAHNLNHQSRTTNKNSPPVKLFTSTSCSYLTSSSDQYHQIHNQNTIINQLKSHLAQKCSNDFNNNNNNNNNNNLNQNEFQFEDFNLPTPTDSPSILNDQQNMNYTQPAQFISRSNSHPDLANTINLTYFNYYYNQSNQNNQSNVYAQNYQNQVNNQNRIKRHPSLNTYKSSLSDCSYQDYACSNINNNFNNYDIYNGFNNNLNLNNTNTNNNNNNIVSNNYHTTTVNNNNNSASYSATTSGVSSSSSLTTTSQDDNLFLGFDAITEFLNKNTSNSIGSNIFEDLPDLEDLMSLVTFESSSVSSVSSASAQGNPINFNYTPDMDLQTNNNQISNSYDYTDIQSFIIDQHISNLSSNLNQNLINDLNNNLERTTRSAPPSPTQQSKKPRPGTNLPWHKLWSKMDEPEKSKAVECLTRIINIEMGLREQLEIIRILNPDTKLKPTDTQFVIDLKMIDDDKFKRIKDLIKIYGISLNDIDLINTTDCPLAKRELRIKRAQLRLKLKQKKEQRQVLKENKSGLFSKTEVVPLKQALPEEDVDIDILS